jgi:hypothetical protein
MTTLVLVVFTISFHKSQHFSKQFNVFCDPSEDSAIKAVSSAYKIRKSCMYICMYQNIKTRVKHGNELSEYFISHTGVKQGKNGSPFSFLYLSFFPLWKINNNQGIQYKNVVNGWKSFAKTSLWFCYQFYMFCVIV